MGSGFFALFDDISTLMEDVAVMSKVSAKKTAGILGDDLAVNAEKASGFVSSRELPILWEIIKGSLLNKLTILPVAFLLSANLPWLINIILIIGGLYLSFEGAEKIVHYFVNRGEVNKEEVQLIKMSKKELLEFEQKKVKSAIITDFILSVEIIIIALGTVIEASIVNQIIVVSLIAFVATVGVYGTVALIVRMDDIGYSILKKHPKESSILHRFGKGLVNALPKVINSLTIIGTIALFLVSGGIFTHKIDFIHQIVPATIPSVLSEFILGLLIGLISVGIFKTTMAIINKIKKY